MQSKRQYLFGTTVLAGVIAVSAPAFAQTAAAGQQAPQATQVEEIVVTGSRIRRDPTTAPTPIIQVQREEILATGQATLIDYLAQIPALSNSTIPSDAVGSVLNLGGLHLANLRALGSNRTLTLIDGRRQVGSVGGSLAVSTNTIPRLLIENTEIITGGASSVYGADAVGGVINFNLRKDFEGVELDVYGSQLSRYGNNYGRRASLLVGKNLFDDRVNVYGFAEYERLDGIETLDLGFLRDSCALVGVDADPANTAAGRNVDGMIDNRVFCGLNTISRPRGGQTTIANTLQPSPLNNPLVGITNCTAFTQATCYSVSPTKTWVYPEGGEARLANFGQRIGNLGSTTLNIGGDGENPGFFNQADRVGSTDAQRYQVGTNIRVTNDITAYFEAKYITEDTFATAQPTFFDFYLNDAAYGANETNGRTGITPSNQNQVLRVSDNAFLPAAVRNAILANTVTNYGNPTVTAPGQPTTTIAAPWARHVSFGEDRSQDNSRQLERYVAAFSGSHGDFGPVRNFGWDLAYTYSKLENQNREIAVDTQRYVLAADAVVDAAGIVNGRPGEVVCRVQLLNAQNPARTNPQTGLGGLRDWSTQAGQSPGTYGDLRDRAEGRAAIAQCTPYNIFGANRASQAARDYTYADVSVFQTNQQHNAIGSVSGQLWDFWGAGAIGVALGAEWRKESTEGIGRSRDAGDRQLFLNTSPDQPYVAYETRELFAEVSLPLFRDSFLGQYAELSGSYRFSDYTTVGQTDVYGVNLVYRPVTDFSIKSSYNTSVRVPTLVENFSPFGQTFANGFADPCATAAITASALAADIRANRIANCTALAAAKGLSYDFAGATLDPNDDYAPVYTSGVAGVSGGNPFLRPEESTSFTFSTVWTPSFIPRFNLVLDYYEIEIKDVIASVSAQAAANNCVNGPSLNQGACNTIFRRVAPVTGTTAADRSEGFKVGAPAGDPIGGFIQGSINYAKRTVRGLDFTASYAIDTQEMFGLNLGTIQNSLRGSWLIEQKQFNNIDNPNDFTEFASTLQVGGSFPRVRWSNTVAWTPNDLMTLTWIVDWQTGQDIVQARDIVTNIDNRPLDYLSTGNFVRHDFAARFNVRDDLTFRVGVSNAFDARQRDILGSTLYSNFDPYGRRVNVSLNYRPW